MTLVEILILIVAGLFVGFINTLAGGGSVISLSVLMLLGLPANVANGTNRIGILVQNIVAVASFKQQKVLETKKALIVAIPAIIGSLIGAWIAADINEKVFEHAIGIIMIMMLIFILFNPQKMLYGNKKLIEKKVSWWQIVLFFFIGMYGGFIQLGIGYFLIASIVLGLGYDLVKTNAIKVFIVLLYTPFTLFVFVWNNQVHWGYGLALTAGTFLGAFIASRLAVKKGVVFVKWVIVTVILFTSAHLFGVIDVKELLGNFIG